MKYISLINFITKLDINVKISPFIVRLRYKGAYKQVDCFRTLYFHKWLHSEVYFFIWTEVQEVHFEVFTVVLG